MVPIVSETVPEKGGVSGIQLIYTLIFKNYQWIQFILSSTRTLENEPIEEISLAKKYTNFITKLVLTYLLHGAESFLRS